MALLGFLLAALIGVTLGLLGAGGSILTVPVLVYVLGYAAKPAIAMSLPVVGVTSLVGAIGHWREGNVQLRTAVLFGLIAMVGSFAGARLAVLVSAGVQLTLLGFVMLGAAVTMLRGSRATRANDAGEDSPAARRPLAVLAVTGLAIGLLTGIVGIGGGFLIVPALVLLARVPMKQAVGTSLVVIAMNSASGALGYAGQFDLPWRFLLGFTGVAVLGILAGTRLVRFVSQGALRRAFAVFLIGLGVLILYQSRTTFLSRGEPDDAPASAVTMSALDAGALRCC
jgi:uncharacterized membrane protein YfcA